MEDDGTRNSQIEHNENISPGALCVDTAPQKNASFSYSLRHNLGDVIRYVYFIRFSLLLWLSMVTLAWADFFPEVARTTRGVLTPSGPWQWFFTGLAVVLPGWFALLAARIVCAYGGDRFDTQPPPCFYIHKRMRWFVFWGAQIPGLLLLLRIAYNVVHEDEGQHYKVFVLLALGAFVALLLWYLIAILYYWMWDPDSTIPVRAFLVPMWSRLPLEEIESLHCNTTSPVFGWLIGQLRKLGPGYMLQDRVSPGHAVASIALLCGIMLYFLLMAISAPVPVPNLTWVSRLMAVVLAGYVLKHFLTPSLKWLSRANLSAAARWLPIASSFIIFGLLLLAVVSLHAPWVIPVIAYVIILLMVVFWTMTGIAFFADRFRIPVLALATATILTFNQWPAEHVFSAEPINSDTITHEKVVDPEEFVKRIAFNESANAQPVIIITATGGGIHAAAWTATVLRALDQEFGDLKFHDHILLMSSVSGGSVATAGFLREYFTDHPFDSASYDRLQGAATCSSLQAVAWGLAYPDTLRLLFPWIFNAFSTLDRFDRGWALQKAFDRNLRDPECVKDMKVREAAIPNLSNLTLNSLARLDPGSSPCIGHELACKHFPAFTLNTTVVETGDRFLLSNYSVFAGKVDTGGVLPAASFLGVYGREDILRNSQKIPYRGGFADISLLTAARLSASFTYVSPPTRLPFEMSQGTKQNAYHFVDGGYFDNDGTNSAIEFLEAASPAFSAEHPLRVLLIEIRNSDDINNEDSPDSYAQQAGLEWNKDHFKSDQAAEKKRFGPIDQLTAPPRAALNAGFGSVTRRNRRELHTLEGALCGSLEVKSFVLDYHQYLEKKKPKTGNDDIDEGKSEVAQPFSWHLTRRQQQWIEDGALTRTSPSDPLEPTVREKITGAVNWYKQAKANSGSRLEVSKTCKAQFLQKDEDVGK